MYIEPEIKLPMPQLFAALGMAFAYYFYLGSYLILIILLLFSAGIAFFRSVKLIPGSFNMNLRKTGILLTSIAVGFSLGIAARGSLSGPAEFGIPQENVTAISGILLEDPRTLQGGSGLAAMEILTVSGDDGLRASGRGKIQVFFPAESIPRLSEFGRGSEIYAGGRVSEGRMGVLFSASSVHIIKPASPLQTFRTGLRIEALGRFHSRSGQSRPVWGGLASALILGIRDDLDVALSEGFRDAGCSYVLALSGMHLAIISGALAFLIRRPLGIRWASLVGALFVLVYVFIAGPQPSLVRSAIMYFIGTAAVFGLLKRDPLSILCMAFIIQLIFQSDTGISVSFIFSYLALFGILTLGQTIRSLFKGHLPELINDSLSASLGAFIFTAPVVALYFDTLRPVGIIAGPIVALISAPFIIISLLALIFSFLPLPLWNLFDFILGRIYRLIEFIISLAAAVPGIPSVNPAPVLIICCALSILLILVHRKDQMYRNKIAAFH